MLLILLIFALTISLIQCSFAAEPASDVNLNSAQINHAATKVKAFVDKNNRLPNHVYVGNQPVQMAPFLKLMTQNLINIENGTPTSITPSTVDSPSSATETVKTGTITKTEYIKIANRINTHIDSYGKAPDRTYITLGYIKFENLVYSYSRILNFNELYNRLPNTLTVRVWKGSSYTPGTTSASKTTKTSESTSASFSSTQITSASSNVKNFVETNHRLPSYVTINNNQVTMPQFLQLMTSNLLNIKSGIKTSLSLKEVSGPSGTTENIKIGNIYKTEYYSLAKNIKTTIDTTEKAPGSLKSTIGTVRYHNLVYTFSRILAFYNTNKKLPNYVSLNPWPNKLGWTSLPQYTYHHQTTDYTCGPSSLKMALSTYGLTVSENWLTKAAKSNSNTGTSQSGMISAVNAVNANYGTKFSMTMEKFTGWNRIYIYLSHGIPVIMRVRSWLDSTGTHYLLVTGINFEIGKVRLGDASYNGKGTFSVKDVGVSVHEVSIKELQNRIQWMLDNGKATKPVMPLFNN